MADDDARRASRAGDRSHARHRPRDRASARARPAPRWSARRRRTKARRSIAESLAAAGHRGTGIRLDVADGAAVDAALADIEARFGAIAILVNNAGITRDNLLLRMKDDEWDAVMATNLKPAFRLAKGVLRGMMKARHGRIIQIGSVVGTSGNPGQANYAAAKAALVGFTKSLAQEVGQPQHHDQLHRPGLHRHRHDQGVAGGATGEAPGEDSPRPAGVARGHRACRRFPGVAAGGLHHRRHAARQRRHVHGLKNPGRRIAGLKIPPSGKIAQF